MRTALILLMTVMIPALWGQEIHENFETNLGVFSIPTKHVFMDPQLNPVAGGTGTKSLLADATAGADSDYHNVSGSCNGIYAITDVATPEFGVFYDQVTFLFDQAVVLTSGIYTPMKSPATGASVYGWGTVGVIMYDEKGSWCRPSGYHFGPFVGVGYGNPFVDGNGAVSDGELIYWTVEGNWGTVNRLPNRVFLSRNNWYTVKAVVDMDQGSYDLFLYSQNTYNQVGGALQFQNSPNDPLGTNWTQGFVNKVRLLGSYARKTETRIYYDEMHITADEASLYIPVSIKNSSWKAIKALYR